MDNSLMLKYAFAKTIVMDEGFQNEILWQSNLTYDDLEERSFLQEIAWVILTSGMKEAIIRNRFDAFSKCFFNWTSAEKIILNRENCQSSALAVFNNKQKISAIINAADQVAKTGFHELKRKIKSDPITTLQQFDYIGPVTVYHLAKNIGLPVAKPDRHLVRIAQMENYNDVQTFCGDISKLSGDPIPVVDIVFWRFATIDSNYLNVLSSLNEWINIQDKVHDPDQNHSYISELSMFQ